MAVKTPSEAAGAHTPADEPRSSVAAILFTALGVLVIAACAVLLSYNGIYQIAVQGNVGPQYSHLYPAVFTLLVLMALWTSYALRTAPRTRRLWADGLILLLVAVAAGASALEASGFVLVPAVATVAAAVAPWLALLVAFRLFLSVVMHLRGEVPGTAPRRPRATGAAQPAAGPRSEDLPAEGLQEEETRPLDDLLGAEPAREAAAEDSDRPAERTDGKPPRPRDPEPTDFRDPGLRPPRPAPTERPSRPERPSSLEPPESAEEPEPARKRRGLLGRRSNAGKQRTPRGEAPAAEAAEEAEQTAAEDASHADSAAETAPLWPNAAAEPEAAEPGTRPTQSAVSASEEQADDDFPFDERQDAEDGHHGLRPEPSPDTADEGPEAGGPDPAAADGASSYADTAAKTRAAAEPAPEPSDADADDTAADAGAAASGARAGEDSPVLPKRTPGAAENPIKRAADSQPAPESADAEPGVDGQAAAPQAQPAEEADGFVHDLPLGDPTNDEAEPGAAALDPAADASAPEEGGAPEDGAAGIDAYGPPGGEAYPAAPPIEKRPMVLKPRRGPQSGPSSPFPEDPPSNRVRSQPRPPEE
ncbi:hypothetical protein LP52_23695 [Streptomonospora alba]|uniref:DUF2637 domain-containing protein n=1 Tax=Streptomonospora alba TaxID=183763 RepID=A0A0C2FC06_9ACTN|nr:DUF2637 domain-containing protein [Streptomonospora alba]KIH96644.1 hypothetical protein LP52_23695 [Streptomonospora alba]